MEPYIGDTVYLECDKWKIISDYVDGRKCDKLFLMNVRLTGTQKKKLLDKPIIVNHIWTIVDSEWKNRVKEKYAKRLLLKGIFYLYNSHGEKNIGFQTFYGKAIRCF